VAMGQIPRSTERISSLYLSLNIFYIYALNDWAKLKVPVCASKGSSVTPSKIYAESIPLSLSCGHIQGGWKKASHQVSVTISSEKSSSRHCGRIFHQ